MANTLRTRQGYEYWIQDGKYIYDYDLFDTLEELEEDLDWSILWTENKAYKPDGEWRFVPEIGWMICSVSR